MASGRLSAEHWVGLIEHVVGELGEVLGGVLQVSAGEVISKGDEMMGNPVRIRTGCAVLRWHETADMRHGIFPGPVRPD